MPRDYRLTEEWKTVEPSSVGLDEKKLLNLEEVLQSQYKNTNGFIIIRKGLIVFEKYYNGYGPLDTHNVASVTKSYTSALVGIAIDEGYIDSVDQQVLSYFPEYVSGADDIIKRTITIRELLTMTAPFAWKTGNKRRFEPLDRLRRQRNWVAYILNLMGRDGLRGSFQYCTAGAHLLSAIITRATGMSAREFANRHLFRPTGMKEIPNYEMKSFTLDDVFGKDVTGWIKDPQGNTTGGWGLTISPRDMARFGLLYLNGGTWDDKQVISKEWIEESTAINPNKYGYLWWLIDEENISGYTAAGSGGNHIFCIPPKDLVVVIAAKIIQKPQERWPLLEKYIIPAIIE
ncbi:MAG: beta-lactamase family protein [Halanaerobiales bacterium]|nr:beta-lactamase family protein [Halanaerobiales bacterium]